MTTTCVICLEDINEKKTMVELECHHQFHGKCIAQSFRYSPRCPMCRDDPQLKEYETKMEEFQRLSRKRREIMKESVMCGVNAHKKQIETRQKHNREHMKRELDANRAVHDRMRRLQRQKERLQHMKDWCDARIRQELLQNDIPLQLKRPKMPLTLIRAF